MFEGSNRENNNKTVSCLYPAEIRLFSKPVFIKDKWSKHSTQGLEKKLQRNKPKEIKRKEVIKMLETNEIKNKGGEKILLTKPRVGSLKRIIKEKKTDKFVGAKIQIIFKKEKFQKMIEVFKVM